MFTGSRCYEFLLSLFTHSPAFVLRLSSEVVHMIEIKTPKMLKRDQKIGQKILIMHSSHELENVSRMKDDKSVINSPRCG